MLFEKLIQYENMLYGDNAEFFALDIVDIDFWIDKITHLPRYRPFLLNNVIKLCEEYIQNPLFKSKLLTMSLKLCPVIIYRLFMRGIYLFDEIFEELDTFHRTACFYFRELIPMDHKLYHKMQKSPDFALINTENNKTVEMMIEYGFLPGTIEYSLKYDDIECLTRHSSSFNISNGIKAQWCIFEWAEMPRFLDFLSFAGYYGSIQCFKYLLINGFEINSCVSQNVACGGCFDLVHMCLKFDHDDSQMIRMASHFCRFSILKYFVENGADININNEINISQPIHIASQCGFISIVDFLIKNGANINSDCMEDEIGTPLQVSIVSRRFYIVQYLLEKRANINQISRYRATSTALFTAISIMDYNVVKYLIEKGADIMVKDSQFFGLNS